MAQILSESHSIKSLYYLDIAHRLEFVRLMMQRLQCNVFMLSYRGYDISYFYYICTIQTCTLNTLWVQMLLFSSFAIHLNLNVFVGMVRVMVILLRKGSHMMHRSVGSFMFYFPDFACFQFLQVSCLLGCT
jgi:hypothetical protein